MRSLLSLLVLFLIISVTPSCKKKDAQKATAQKLQNKWTFLNATDNNHYSGIDHAVTINGNTGDYMDFRTDGKVYLRIQSSNDTSNYVLSGDIKIIIDNSDTLTIQTLTDNALKLYEKAVYSTGVYEELTYNLSR